MIISEDLSISMWMIDQRKPDKMSSLKCLPRYFFKLTHTTFSCLNLWHMCKPKLQVGGNIINNGRNVVKSSEITYNSQLEEILSLSSIFKCGQIIRDYVQLQAGGPFEEVLLRDCERSPPKRRWALKSRKCKRKKCKFLGKKLREY